MLTLNFCRLFPNPLLHSAIRFIGSSLLGVVPLFISGDLSVDLFLQLMQDFAIPATFLFVANSSNSLALHLIGNTLTSVVKSWSVEYVWDVNAF